MLTHKIYFALRELGRACRTTFLMQYLDSIDIRYQLQAATNISESWNEFTHWLAFGGSKLRKPDRRGNQN
ncbi:MAG: Tn3 family transposase [Pseudobacteriovorax sp.]|nr:Tn3 family transposase [Pseudobacteriovorax sp.]